MFFCGIFSSFPENNGQGGGVPVGTNASETSPAAFDQDRRQDNADIQRFLRGDSRGFEDLMNRYRQRAYGIALSVTGDHDQAMDAVQKAFLRVYRNLKRFREGAAFFPWFYRIVKNTALNQRRDEKRHEGEMPLEWVKQNDGRPNPLELVVADDLRQRLWDGIQELPEAMREVFMLYHFQGMKYKEIADACGIPPGTVMSRLHAARTRLRSVADLEDKQ